MISKYIKLSSGIVAVAMTMASMSAGMAGELKSDLQSQTAIPYTNYPQASEEEISAQDLIFKAEISGVAGAVLTENVSKRLKSNRNSSVLGKPKSSLGKYGSYAYTLTKLGVTLDSLTRVMLNLEGVNPGASPLLHESAVFVGLKPREYYDGKTLVGSQYEPLLGAFGSSASADSGR